MVRLTADPRGPRTAGRSPVGPAVRMFQNFGHRGRVFREAVAAIGARRLDA